MKECDITQDLLIFYCDETLRSGSKEFVENHLKECNKCKEVLKDIKEDEKIKTENVEIDYLKKMRKKNIVKNVFLTILGLIAVIFIIVSVLSFYTYFKNLEVEIFLEDSITESEQTDIKNAIKEIDENARIEYSSKEDELQKMKERLGENQNMLDGYENEKNIFPASFTIKSDITKLIEIENRVKNLPGAKATTSSVRLNPYIMFFVSTFNIGK